MELEDRITIATPEGLSVHLQLAGVGSRFIAGCFDLTLQLIIIAVIGVIVGNIVGGAVAAAVIAVTVFAVIFFYDVLFEVRAGGRTPGKRLTHLRVVRDNGTPVDFQASSVRNLMRLVDGLTFLYLPTLFGIFFTRRNQRPGDLAGGTLVIRDAPKMSPSAPAGAAVARTATGRPDVPVAGPGPVAGERAAAALDVSAVTEAEVAAVRRFLARRDELDRDARQRLAHRLEAGLRAKVSGVPEHHNPERFLEALVEAKARV